MTDVDVTIAYREDDASSFYEVAEAEMPETALNTIYDGEEVEIDSLNNYLEQLSEEWAAGGNFDELQESALTGHDLRDHFEEAIKSVKGSTLEEYGLIDENGGTLPPPRKIWDDARDNITLTFAR